MDVSLMEQLESGLPAGVCEPGRRDAVRVEMRDGTALMTRVYLPQGEGRGR
ncbi:hypothetical protein LJK88_15295 [Paenibacillus sp. P26]|nr:hypothetical protein LJK88_15295 [Paenibacillus sp. P26]